MYLLHLGLAVDQLANALLGGYADETLSARAYRTEQDGRRFGKITRPCIDLLFFWQPEHCKSAMLSEQKRKQLPGFYSQSDTVE